MWMYVYVGVDGKRERERVMVFYLCTEAYECENVWVIKGWMWWLHFLSVRVAGELLEESGDLCRRVNFSRGGEELGRLYG